MHPRRKAIGERSRAVAALCYFVIFEKDFFLVVVGEFELGVRRILLVLLEGGRTPALMSTCRVGNHGWGFLGQMQLSLHRSAIGGVGRQRASKGRGDGARLGIRGWYRHRCQIAAIKLVVVVVEVQPVGRSAANIIPTDRNVPTASCGPSKRKRLRVCWIYQVLVSVQTIAGVWSVEVEVGCRMATEDKLIARHRGRITRMQHSSNPFGFPIATPAIIALACTRLTY